MQVYFYLLCFQNEALVASHLNAEEFGSYLAVGTKKRTVGNVIFLEINPFTGSALDFEKGRERCQPHPDGSPKHSKYLGVYRVLEHIPLSALGALHLVTRDGRVLSLEAKPYEQDDSGAKEHMYVELCPVTPRVVSVLSPAEFARHITNPENPVYVPRLVFCDQLLDREADGSLGSYLPYRDTQHIVDCLSELGQTSKPNKTVSRNPALTAFYRTIGKGFFVGDPSGLKYYPYPSRAELDRDHHFWWRSASMG